MSSKLETSSHINGGNSVFGEGGSKNDEPFSISKFLSPPMEGNEASLFLSWLQNRLREHYLKSKEHRIRATEFGEYGPVLCMDELDICFSELKVIDIEEESHWMTTHGNRQDPDSSPPSTHDGCVVKNIQCKLDENLPWETGVRKFSVTFQENGMASGLETLDLVLEVTELHDVQLLEKISPPFIAYSEKHAIDVFSLLFPTLQGWLYEKHFEMNLPIPTCYYSKYEDNNKMEFENLLEHGTDSLDLSSLDSKNPDDIVESQRILILNNVLKQGFKPKNVQGTSFLSPMNVTHGLKEIAKLHALSWAFSKSTRKPLMEHFTFLKMTTFLPYLKSKLEASFPTLLTLSEDYLNKHMPADKPALLERMRFIHQNIDEILSTCYPPHGMSSSEARSPVTLLHHGLDYTTALFCHRQNSPRNEDGSFAPSSTDESGSGSSTPPNVFIRRELCLIDWKCSTYGCPMFDVASFLLTALPPKTRKRETTSLLQLYADEFTATATSLGHGEDVTWNWEDLREDYNKGLLYGVLQISTNITPELSVTENDMEVILEALKDVVSLQIV